MNEEKKEAETEVKQENALVEAKKEENKIAKLDKNVAATFNAFTNLETQKEFADILIKSKALPKQYVNSESVIMAANYGRELGFDFVTALNSIYYVSGKPSLSTQAMVALCLSKGIIHKTIEDYEIMYKKDKDDNFVLNDKGNKIAYLDSDSEPIRKTTIEYIRVYKHLNNYVSTERFSYTTKEAKDAGLMKNVWMQYPR
jgi:hypothetical protein